MSRIKLTAEVFHDPQVLGQHFLIGRGSSLSALADPLRIGRRTPSTLVPFKSTSQPISAARNAAGVGGEEGAPTPAAKITTRPFSRWRKARLRT